MLMELRDHPVGSVQWEAMERRERAVKQETRDRLGRPALEAPEERRVRRENPAHPELLGLPADADPPETMAPRATPDLLASLATLDPLVSPVSLDWTVWEEKRETTETAVSPAPLVLLARLEYQDHLANGDPWGKPARRADKERKDPREKPGLRDLSVKQDLLDPKDPLERPVQKGCAVFLGLSVNKDFLVLLAKMAPLDL